MAEARARARAEHCCEDQSMDKSVEGAVNEPPPAYDELFPYSCDDLPPPYPLAYEKYEVFDRNLLPESQNVLSWSDQRQTQSEKEEERCSTCFDPICENKDKKISGDSVTDGFRSYHYECYVKTRGPRCHHCCFALIPWPQKHLSGRWVTYEGQRYHEECYEREAGPRCSSCYDVIVEKRQEGFSGMWRCVDGRRYHDECFIKKLKAEERAKDA